MAQGALTVFCDLDGTLVEISERHYRVYADLAHAMNVTPLDKPRYWALKRAKSPWSEILALTDLPVHKRDDFLSQFVANIEGRIYLELDTLFPNVLATLRRLTFSGHVVLVTLRRNRRALAHQLTTLGLSDQFFAILVGDHSGNADHDTKAALIEPHLRKGRNVVVGDTEADILAGKKLGLETFAVASGIRDVGFLARLQPDHLAEGIWAMETP